MGRGGYNAPVPPKVKKDPKDTTKDAGRGGYN